MQDRIKQIRKHYGLSQEKFADALDLSASIVQSYELGRRIPSSSTIYKICDVFKINRNWLETGEGEMELVQDRDLQIAGYIGTLLNNPDGAFQKQIIKVMSEMTVDEWKLVESLMRKILDVNTDN